MLSCFAHPIGDEWLAKVAFNFPPLPDKSIAAPRRRHGISPSCFQRNDSSITSFSAGVFCIQANRIRVARKPSTTRCSGAARRLRARFGAPTAFLSLRCQTTGKKVRENPRRPSWANIQRSSAARNLEITGNKPRDGDRRGRLKTSIAGQKARRRVASLLSAYWEASTAKRS